MAVKEDKANRRFITRKGDVNLTHNGRPCKIVDGKIVYLDTAKKKKK